MTKQFPTSEAICQSAAWILNKTIPIKFWYLPRHSNKEQTKIFCLMLAATTFCTRTQTQEPAVHRSHEDLIFLLFKVNRLNWARAASKPESPQQTAQEIYPEYFLRGNVARSSFASRCIIPENNLFF